MKKGLRADESVGLKVSRIDSVCNDLVIQFGDDGFIVARARNYYDYLEVILIDEYRYDNWLSDNLSTAVSIGLLSESEGKDLEKKMNNKHKVDQEERDRREFERLSKKFGREE